MAGSNFVDYVKIYCRSGKGGAGSMHFHRDNLTAKGGPDGGDGGRGGHIILRANKNLWTLIHLKYARHIYAGDGGGGSASRSFGKDGEDRVIEVPCGTVLYDAETGEFLDEKHLHPARHHLCEIRWHSRIHCRQCRANLAHTRRVEGECRLCS